MKKLLTVITVLILVFTLAACGTIESGYTGVMVVDGIIQDEPITEGRYGNKGARTEIIKVNNKRQNVTYNETISGESEDQTVVYAQGVNITYQISRDASIWMVRNMGVDFQNNILPAAKVASAVKNALANIETEKCTNRSYIEPAVKLEMQTAVDEYYYPDAVKIIDVSINQMDYEDSYNAQIAQISALKKQAEADTISNKMKIENAKADAEVETTKAAAAKRTAEANAEVSLINAQSEAEIAKVKAESNAQVTAIEAEAEAEAYSIIGKTLTPEILDKIKLERWGGKDVYVVGNGGALVDVGQ